MIPKITVLMPVHNGARHLPEAIASTLKQTFDDFEFLIIDDASTDDSVSLIDTFNDERIRLVRNETNLGQVVSQNKGLQLARGEYIARLDQDDSSSPNRFARQVAVLDAEPSVAVVGTWMYAVDSEGDIIDVWQGRHLNDLADYLFAILTNSLPLYHPSVMFRREAVLQLDGYDETLPFCEDNDLWRRLALARHDARVVAEPLTSYRVHEGQQSVSQAKIQRKNHVFSQERFVQSFTDEYTVRSLRLFMTCGSLFGGDFWDSCSSLREARELCVQLESMLGTMRSQLQLNTWEYSKLVHLVRCHAAKVAGRAWRRDIGRQLRASRPIYLYAMGGGFSVLSSVHTWLYPLIYVAAPILPMLRNIKRIALRSVHLQRWYSLLRKWARRSNTLLSAYRKIY